MKKNLLLISFIVLFFTACSISVPTPNERKSNTLSLIENKNLLQESIKTSSFDIFSIRTKNLNCKTINIFVEGDGLAWITRNIVSSNPTPIDPVALKLMLNDKNICKVYLARPCQYINSQICEERYWTSHRFSSEVIKSYDEVLNKIKSKEKNIDFRVVGFSGGGAVVTLLASKRDDIKKIVTVAGNLNHKLLNKIHRVSQMPQSLNPINIANDISNISQVHYVGEKDWIVPIEIVNSYKKASLNDEKIKVIIVKNATHTKGWDKIILE